MDETDDGGTDVHASTSTVLVVDDEAVVRDSFTVSLESNGYEVRTAASGDEALDAVEEDVDIVLLDRRMPLQSGDDVLREIRSRNVDCQIALVTAVDPDFDILEIDCDDYLVKPVENDELIETVERLALLDQYDETQRELSSLRVKRNVLEVEKRPSELENSSEFAKLQAQIDALEQNLDDLENAFDERLGYH